MEDLKKYEEDFFLFLEAGFIAINQADEDSAVKLFKTCELLQPENPLIKIGFGYLHLHFSESQCRLHLTRSQKVNSCWKNQQETLRILKSRRWRTQHSTLLSSL